MMKTIILFLVVVSLIFNFWSYFKIQNIINVNNAQGAGILEQKAAWQVLISTLPPEQQKEFVEAVNKLLK